MDMFRPAERRKAKLRLGIAGTSGSGKTYSALKIAFGIGGKVAVIDTENGSADLYAHLGSYDVAILSAPFSPQKYIDLIRGAEKAGYDTIIIDSLSHAWEAEGGILDLQDLAMKKQTKENSYTAWRNVTPIHNQLVQAMLQSKCHIIATIRSKQEYALIGGKVEKLALKPIQRDGMEYEFTCFLEITQNHEAYTTKDRTEIFKDRMFQPTVETGKQFLDWLNTGSEPIRDPKEELKEAMVEFKEAYEAVNYPIEDIGEYVRQETGKAKADRTAEDYKRLTNNLKAIEAETIRKDDGGVYIKPETEPEPEAIENEKVAA